MNTQLADGYTLTHEHMSINLSPGDLGTDSFDSLCADLKEIYGYGVRNIVDMTNQTMGRDPAYAQRIAEETGINIILSTGTYLEQYLAPYLEHLSVDELTRIALDELESGIPGTRRKDGAPIKAGVIGEMAWSFDGQGPLEQKGWEAMTIAAKKTGCVVSTHPSKGPQQIQQAQYLINAGINPRKIIIGHIEFFPNTQALLDLLAMGVNIGVDMIGKSCNTDFYRMKILCLAKIRGYLSQVTLSLDLCRKQDLKAEGGYGYPHLFESFLPDLMKLGFTQADIDLMLRDNPKRIWEAGA